MKNYLVIKKIDRYNKYQTQQYTHAHTSTLYSEQMVMASTWPGDNHGRPSVPTDSSHKLHIYIYGALSIKTYLLTHNQYNEINMFYYKSKIDYNVAKTT